MDRTPGWGREDTDGGGGLGTDDDTRQSIGSWVDQAVGSTGSGSFGGVALEAEALPGRLPDGYQLLRRIGSGRHGTVLLCRDEAGHEVAVKMLHLTVEDEGARLSAHAELLSAGSAGRHPCSVPVEDAGFTLDGHPYLVQGFCRGGNAQAKLANSGPFPVDEVVVIGIRSALSVASAHRRGLLHLDVRPANVLFDEAGDALLADHGVTRVIQRSAPQVGAVFDPMYSARELFGWERPGPSADVYGLGATLYALLNGLPAYAEAGGTSWSALYHEVMHGELPHPDRHDVPPQLFDLVRRMMAVNSEGRPPLTEVYRELRLMLPPAYASRVPATGPEPAPEPVLPGWDPADDVTPEEQAEAERLSKEAEADAKRRNQRRMLAAGIALVVFAGGATGMTLYLHDRHEHEHRTVAEPSGSPTAPGGLSEVPAAERAALVPHDVEVAKVAGGVKVSWNAPKDTSKVTAYGVESTKGASGAEIKLVQATPGQRSVTFTDAGSLRPGVCFLAGTAVSGPKGLEYAAADPVCPAGG